MLIRQKRNFGFMIKLSSSVHESLLFKFSLMESATFFFQWVQFSSKHQRNLVSFKNVPELNLTLFTF